MTCASNEDSDQYGHPPNLIKVFAVCSKDSQGLKASYADSEVSVQTGRMARLIWVFAGSTGHFAGFVMRRFIFCESMWRNDGEG